MPSSWPTQQIKDRLGLLSWGRRLRPRLQGVGPDAAAALLMFNRHIPIHAFPVPQFNPHDRTALLGLVSFLEEPHEMAFSFNPRHHLLPLSLDGNRILLMALLARDGETLRIYVEQWCERAKATRECASVIEGLFVAYVGCQPS